MPAAAPSLPSRLLLWGGLTENALQPSASNGKDRFHYLLLQSLQISFLKGLEAFQQLEHSGFCFLHQCCFLSFLRFHVQGSPLCCSPCLVLQMRILLFGSFAYNFFIHPSRNHQCAERNRIPFREKNRSMAGSEDRAKREGISEEAPVAVSGSASSLCRIPFCFLVKNDHCCYRVTFGGKA